MVALAAYGYYTWDWDEFVSGTLVNFASSVTLVAVFFLLERRFESRETRLRVAFITSRSRERKLLETHRALTAACAALNEGQSWPLQLLRGHVYLVDRRLVGEDRMALFSRVALDMEPFRTSISVTRGRGVAGRAWQDARPNYVDSGRG